MSTRLAVLGAGSWGTVFSQVLADAGCEVVLWARREETATQIREQHRNPRYLGEHDLPSSITATADIAAALDGADGAVVAIPAQVLRETLRGWRSAGQVTALDIPVLSLVKGIERGTDARISQILADEIAVGPELFTVLSGPNLSAEIAQRRPSGTVIAGADAQVVERVAAWCDAPYLRAYTSDDVIGVEIAGAVKNVIAIVVGAASGLGHGQNTIASLITRGLAEITRLGTALGGKRDTFAGLAGMGDLVATCASPLSRNYRLGEGLGRGLNLEQAMAEVGQTAEGVATARAVSDLSRALGVDMPLTTAIVDVVDRQAKITDVTAALLSRSVRPE